MRYCYLDTETCGLHGVAVIMQYAFDDGPIHIHNFWTEPAEKSLQLIKEICECCVVGFNMVFDWFHIQKITNMLSLVSGIPDIKEMASIELQARDGLCVKPRDIMDFMLIMRRGELQITMERSDVRIRRIPTVLAYKLAKLLNNKMELNPLLFARSNGARFKVRDTDESHLKNLVMKFRPSTALKTLMKHMFNKNVISYGDIEAGQWPHELGYAPYAAPENWTKNKYAWPRVIQHHIDHWTYNKLAREYAANDVEYLRDIHKYLGDVQPDTNSRLAACVASSRWKGFKVDVEKLKSIRGKYASQIEEITSPSFIKDTLLPMLDDMERAIWSKSDKEGKYRTGKKQLEALMECVSDEAKAYIKRVLGTKIAQKKLQIIDKLIQAGRFHASFKVYGALSNRMSGADGLNPQGIDRTKEMRECFPLAFDDEVLTQGDMTSFEITLAESEYGDLKLRSELMTCEKCDIQVNIVQGKLICPQCSGSETRKFHALFGMSFFDMTYEDIKNTKGTSNDLYTKAKTAAFATLYGATPNKIKDVLDITEDEANEGYFKFWAKYAQAGKARKLIERAFTSLSSNDRGIISWRQPENYVESMTGSKRWFTLENYLIKFLFDLAEKFPFKIKGSVVRSQKGKQTITGACRSALYGSAFSIQNSMIRQAANHRIQSTGADITKEVQLAIWNLQPYGVHPWLVRPMNIHDEIQCPCHPSMADTVKEIVYAKVEEFRELVPLIGIDFGRGNSWADK